MTTEQLKWFIKGIIEHYITIVPIDPEKYLNFSVYHINDRFKVEFYYYVVDIPSTEEDPDKDNSITKLGQKDLWLHHYIFEKDIVPKVTEVLDEIAEQKLITTREE